jgi:hypothetical protein
MKVILLAAKGKEETSGESEQAVAVPALKMFLAHGSGRGCPQDR